MRHGFLGELIVVGASVVIIGGLLKVLGDTTGLSKTTPWPVWLLLTGGLVHLAWEFSGGNQYYCETLWPATKVK